MQAVALYALALGRGTCSLGQVGTGQGRPLLAAAGQGPEAADLKARGRPAGECPRAANLETPQAAPALPPSEPRSSFMPGPMVELSETFLTKVPFTPLGFALATAS